MSRRRSNSSKKKKEEEEEEEEEEEREEEMKKNTKKRKEDDDSNTDEEELTRGRRSRRSQRSTRNVNRGKSAWLGEDSDDNDDDDDGGGLDEEKGRGRQKKKVSYKEDNDDDDEFMVDEEDEEEDDDDFISSEDELESDDGEFANIRRSTRDRQKIQRLSPGRAEAIKRRQRREGTRANGNVINYNEDDNDDDFDDFIDDDGVEEEKKKKKDGRGRPRKEADGGNDMKKNGAFFSAGTPPSAPKNGRRQSGKWLDDTDDSDADGFDALHPTAATQRGGIGNTNNIDISRFDALLGAPGYTADGGGPKKIGETKDAEITPLTVDPSLTFNAVGGLDKYVDALKEMVFLPLLYPEIFERFKMTPPRGVLLYGAPGTGKTLIARALAASCSRAGSEVSFFMRKGADVLSKWVGESDPF